MRPLTPRMTIVLLLRAGESYGKELQLRAADAKIELSDSQVYNGLHRLRSDGLVESRLEPTDGPGRSRIYYRLTDAGQAEALCFWESMDRLRG